MPLALGPSSRPTAARCRCFFGLSSMEDGSLLTAIICLTANGHRVCCFLSPFRQPVLPLAFRNMTIRDRTRRRATWESTERYQRSVITDRRLYLPEAGRQVGMRMRKTVPHVDELRFRHRIGDYCDTRAAVSDSAWRRKCRQAPLRCHLLLQLCFCRRGKPQADRSRRPRITRTPWEGSLRTKKGLKNR